VEKRLSIVICDDQAVVREGLAAILGTIPHIDVVGLASQGQEAVEMAEKYLPDVVLMDLNMPHMNGIQAIRRIREKFPAIAVLVLTTYATDEWLFDAIRAGAAGYLLKDTRREDLVRAIEDTAKGKSHIDPAVAGRILAQVASLSTASLSETPMMNVSSPLTEREIEILRLLVQGFSNPEIGQKLFLAPGTVRNYVSEIFTKLGVSDRTQAAVLAIKLGYHHG